MTPFSIFAPAKVNLALHVLGRRADGYHDLDSIVAFADVGDRLTFAPAGAFSITADGPFASALPAAEDNIITRAWPAASAIAARRGLELPPAAVHLTKNLPVASGIGGGSANAAAALRGFLRMAGIETLDQEIMAAALKLGADVPVCLFGKACRMQGIGDCITPLEDFQPLRAVLVNPLVAVSTPAVFRELGLEKGENFNAPITDQSDPSCWRNDLAEPAIALAPVIGEVLAVLKSLPGVAKVFMSGSGATCFVLTDAAVAATGLNADWWFAATTLS